MNASVLLLPFLLIRFGLFAYISRDAMGRAAHFPPWRARRPSPTIFIRRPRWAYSFARFFCGYSPRPYLFRRNCPVWPGRDPFAMDDSVFFPSRPGRAQCQRDLPALPQPHVCGLLPLFPGHGPADPPPCSCAWCWPFRLPPIGSSWRRNGSAWNALVTPTGNT